MDVISTMMGVPRPTRTCSVAGPTRSSIARRASRDPEGRPRGLREPRPLLRRGPRPPPEESGDDLVSALVDAEIDGERLTDAEIIGFCFLLVIAGNETTTKMLGNAMVLLHRHPDQRAWLVANPNRIADAVEEIVRFDNSSQMLARLLMRDVTLHGRTMPAGKKVLLLIGSANRDERAIARPNEFDVHRTQQPHLAFGYGIHVCLGAPLARLEGRVALKRCCRGCRTT
jgi:cytochrome P450